MLKVKDCVSAFVIHNQKQIFQKLNVYIQIDTHYHMQKISQWSTFAMLNIVLLIEWNKEMKTKSKQLVSLRKIFMDFFPHNFETEILQKSIISLYP